MDHNITIWTTFFSHNHNKVLNQYRLQQEVNLTPLHTHDAQTITYLVKILSSQSIFFHELKL